MSKRKGPTPKVRRWEPFGLDPRSPLPDGDLLYGNGWWTVHVTIVEPDAGLDGLLHLSIHDKPRSTRHDWREMQRIKNEVAGEEREAVELYPAESRLVDTANEYHLWVLGVGERWPFGFTERLVDVSEIPAERFAEAAESIGVDVSQLHKSRQRSRGD